jgi:Zn-dependent protease
MIALFNLLPGLPLDGGRLVRAVLWRLLDDRVQATRWAGVLGLGLGAAILFSGFVEVGRSSLDVGIWLGLVGIFLVGMAWHATIHP